MRNLQTKLTYVFLNRGKVSEWLKEHAWKACVRESVPWVRIPPFPFQVNRSKN